MIAGIFKLKDTSLDLRNYKDKVLKVLNQFNKADKTGCLCQESILLAQATIYNTIASHNENPVFTDLASGLSVVSWARLDNRQEIAEKIGIDSELLNQMSDSELISKAYLKWKDKCVEQIYGDFVFAIYDAKSKTIFCARDHMGIKPFYYYADENIFIFTTTLTLFHELKIVPVCPDKEWVSKYLLHMSMDFEKTAYKKIFKLKPAHFLSIANNKLSFSEYFRFNPEVDPGKSLEEYLHNYRKLLDLAVYNRLNSNYNFGSEVSGGLDSSTVTALAAKFFEQPLANFYTFGFARLEMEPQYILSVCRHYHLLNNFICCCDSAPKEESILHSLRALGYPSEYGVATGHEIFYKTAQTFGVRTLLSGFGGDEFVTSFHGHLALHELFDSGQYVQLFQSMGGTLPLKIARLIKFIIKNRKAKQNEYNQEYTNIWNQYWPYNLVKEDIVEELKLKESFFEISKFDAGYRNLNKFTLENRLAPFISTRADNCSLMANSYGIDYRWPLLDVKLIQYFLSIPACKKYSSDFSRYFHRKAVQDALPVDVIWKKSKYMGERRKRDDNIENSSITSDCLHDSLNEIIDIKKFMQQKALVVTKQNLPKELKKRIKRNIYFTDRLDKWLKMYHPKGCTW